MTRCKKIIEKFERMNEKGWYDDVDSPEGNPETGLWDKSASAVAKVLASDHGNYKDAMAALMFFQNRMGKRASNDDLSKIASVEKSLQKQFKRNADGTPKK